ncbi:MAG TPA: serine hydrolase [Streptosporangiaceae bacterium]
MLRWHRAQVTGQTASEPRPSVAAIGLAAALPLAATALIVGASVAPVSASTARAGAQQATATASAVSTASAVNCVSATAAHHALAKRLETGIARALSGRSSVAAVALADSKTTVRCTFRPFWHFHSASIVKVIILGTLLHDLAVKHQFLTSQEVTLTTEMITESSNDAATTLWDQLGMRKLRRFLRLAKMTHTELGQNGYWGLTQVTANDELILLRLLTFRNSVLDKPSRAYALKLMAHVIASQRWGVPAGAPASVTVHVKNGWLPDPQLWVINSIGAFTSRSRVYRIVVLTRGNPSMTYGVDTVQRVAEVIHSDLNPGQQPAVLPSRPYPSWGTPDERIPH